MTHHNLVLQRLVKLERDGYYDEQSRCGISVCQRAVTYQRKDRGGEQSHYREEDSTPKSNAQYRTRQIIARCLARSDARQKAAVLLNVFTDLRRIKLNLRIEKRKYENPHRHKDEVKHHAPPIAAGGHIASPPHICAILSRTEETEYHLRETQQRERKDEGQNAAAVDFDGYVGRLSAVDFVAFDLFGILNLKLSFRTVNPDDKRKYDQQYGDKEHEVPAAAFGKSVGNDTADIAEYRLSAGRHDTDENQNRNAVADTVFGNTLTNPHRKHAAGNQNNGNHDKQYPHGENEVLTEHRGVKTA